MMMPRPLVPPPPFAHPSDGGLPVGIICPYAGRLANPFDPAAPKDPPAPALWLEHQGWMLCDGRELRVVNCPSLFAVIGNLYGGDGQTTFWLPDYRGRFLRCVDDGAGRDPDVGERTVPNGSELYDGVGSEQGFAMENHQHFYNESSVGKETKTFNAGEASLPFMQTPTGDPIVDALGTPAQTSTETRPLNLYVNYLIKYR